MVKIPYIVRVINPYLYWFYYNFYINAQGCMFVPQQYTFYGYSYFYFQKHFETKARGT